ncbi:mannitol-1-phosphate 5-dehydrogenase [Buchnera aphidicola]|uniref:Mannitol-1-phosphate 5-dehydrogenase n=1 Tax=Buchnera aphidicola subsp. Rhopalosiphum maidis TaxID=118109 RepID=A0A3G2I6C1_BUCRM|nr:mannitol-1-phosphate 5-dehydrogenase [Buchnera aphidicola]AYN24917.1 mannitol-1-phosphate 5-dehydrogenase [Buchnera aphidicola (Rhopalosiphum maidis)]
MQALHFGAGNIGRGFIARVLLKSGFHLIFSDVDQEIINIINHYKKYKIKLVGNNFEKIIDINNISAVNSHDPNVLKIISNVDLITTASGVNALHKIASILIEGIILRMNLKCKKPLNIIACENKIKATSFLKEIIFNQIPVKYYNYFNEYIGFVDCSIDTIIPTVSSKEENLFLIAEDFKEWIVNINQFKGTVPKIIDMTLSNNLMPFINRKILTLNTGHSIAAYLGFIKSYKTIYESMLDCSITKIVKNAMKESGLVLVKRYNFDKKDHLSYINKIFLRFKNPFFLDKIERVARNPLQKLNKNERLIQPFLGAIKYSLPYSNLVKGIAAALHYRNVNDIESIKLSSLIQIHGIEKTLVKVCNLNEKSKEINLIISEYYSILKNFL